MFFILSNYFLFRRTKIEYFSGTGFALFHGGPYNRLRKWVCDRTRVTIKLHANRCLQCVISAYDKHQNLLVRDCDEVYIPSKRIGLVQTCPNAMPAKFKYEQLNGTNILSRYLKSSIIMGSSIICIYDDSQ
jgi:small nuclear ribonucleoprotein (snRNP)-like protein